MNNFVIGTYDNHVGWKDVNLATYNLNSPLVLVLNGNGGTDVSHAIEVVRLTKSFLTHYNENNVEVLGISYAKEENKNFGTLSEQELNFLVDCLFMPQVSKNGLRTNIVTAKKNMRQITIFSHCHGATITYRINEILTEKLDVLGYNETEIAEILAQIFVVGFAPQNTDNRNSGLYIKSFDDEVSGYKYKKEVVTYNIINLFESSIDCSKIFDDRIIKAMNTPIKSDTIPFVGCGYPERNKNILNIYTHSLGLDGDHSLRNIKRDALWNLTNAPISSQHADTCSLCIAECLNYAVKNSWLNRSQNFVGLNLEDVETMCASLILKGNNSPRELAEYLRYMMSNSFSPIYALLNKHNITEKDIILGNFSMKQIKNLPVGSIDFSNSVFQEMITNARTAKGGYAFPNQEKPKKPYPVADAYGIIWENGDVSDCKDLNQVLFATFYHKFFRGENIRNSIMFKIEKIDNTRTIEFANNFGSLEELQAENFEELIKTLRKTYRFGLAPKNINQEQEYSIQSLKNKYGIGENFEYSNDGVDLTY